MAGMGWNYQNFDTSTEPWLSVIGSRNTPLALHVASLSVPEPRHRWFRDIRVAVQDWFTWARAPEVVKILKQGYAVLKFIRDVGGTLYWFWELLQHLRPWLKR